MSPAVKLDPTAPVSVSSAMLIEETIPAMCSDNALKRSQATHLFEGACGSLNTQDLRELSAAIETRLACLDTSDPAIPWHVHSGTLLSAVYTVPYSRELRDVAQKTSLVAITHAEPRVRTVASNLLAVISKENAECTESTSEDLSTAWKHCVRSLLKIVEARFQIGEDARLAEAGRVAAREAGKRAQGTKLNDVKIVHETEGWKGLETALLALKGVIEGCGKRIFEDGKAIEDVPCLEEILNIVTKGKHHENRFVREGGLRLLTAIIEVSPKELLCAVMERTVKTIADGLQDNWSQVRYASSLATRTVLRELPADVRRTHYHLLLPRMCLNRHYVAEGVRVMSQSTWTNIISTDGRAYLVESLDEVITFYESQCAADNHAVREAACQCFGEVASKLPKEAVDKHVVRIIAALVDCFKDESWPVRDHACRAISQVLKEFPAASEKSEQCPEVYKLFIAHLADNIPSVRDNCAEAVVNASKSFPRDHEIFGLTRLATAAKELIACVTKQGSKEFSNAHAHVPHRHTGYGAAAKLARDNDVELHTGQVMYSCGSLAPKLRRGGGCMDHGFSRPKEPWEEADGGLRLWRRIAQVEETDDIEKMGGAELARSVIDQVVVAAEFASKTAFAHQSQLAESVWGQIAAAMRYIPKEPAVDEESLRKLVAAVEKDRKLGDARVQNAAAGGMRAMRAWMGFKQYSDVLKKANAAEKDMKQ